MCSFKDQCHIWVLCLGPVLYLCMQTRISIISVHSAEDQCRICVICRGSVSYLCALPRISVTSVRSAEDQCRICACCQGSVYVSTLSRISIIYVHSASDVIQFFMYQHSIKLIIYVIQFLSTIL